MKTLRQVTIGLLLLSTATAASAAPAVYQQVTRNRSGETSYTLYNFAKKKPHKATARAGAEAASAEYREIPVAPSAGATQPAEPVPTYSQSYTPPASTTASAPASVQSNDSGAVDPGYNYGYGPGYGYGYGYGSGVYGGSYGPGHNRAHGGLNGSGYTPSGNRDGRNCNNRSASSTSNTDAANNGPAAIPSITSSPAIPPGMLIR